MEEELKAERKKFSQWALFWGGVSLVVGALLCLIYLMVYKPHKIGGLPADDEGGRNWQWAQVRERPGLQRR